MGVHTQARAQETLREKLAGIVVTYDDTSREIQSTLKQMDEAFELLMAKPDQAQRRKESLPAEDEDGLEWEEVAIEDTAEGTTDSRHSYCKATERLFR